MMHCKKSLPLVLAAVAVSMAHAEHRNRAMVCSFGRSTAVQDGKVSPREYSAAFSFTFAVDCQDRLGMVLEENPMRTWYAWDNANIYIAARYATPSPDETVRVEALFSASGNKSARDVVRFSFDGSGNTSAGATGKLLREEGHVTLEAAIPWKSIGVTCRPGVPVFLNIARISSKAGSSPVVGATARGPVDDASVFLSFMPSENVSRWSYGPFGQTMKTGRVSPSLEAVAAMDGEMYSDIVASVRLPPRFFWRKRVKCRKGEKIALSEDAPAFPTGRYMITLKDADGTKIVDASYPYHDDTKVAYVGFLTDPKTKELQLVTANWLSAGEKCLAHLVFKDYETEKKVVWEADVPIKAKRGTFEQNLDITKLPPGRYLVEWSFLDGCGKKLDSGIGYYAKPDGKAPWDDCTAGMEDTVPSPWTAPVFGDDNVCVWGRSMRLGGGGLLSSAVSQGKELLAEPVRLVLGGKSLEFDVKRIEKCNSSARYRLVPRNSSVPVTVDVKVEFDGFMLFEVTYGGAGVKMSSLEACITLDRDNILVYDDFSDWNRKLVLKGGREGTWWSNVVDFPFFWTGDMLRGLMGGAPTMRGWHLKDKAHGRRITADGRTVSITMRFVDTPFEMDAPRTLAFYIDPTPTRPKNMVQAAMPLEKTKFWTGQYSRFFDTVFPEEIDRELIAPFMKMQEEGVRVFYYSSAHGHSPLMPWWGWYARDWTYHWNPLVNSSEMPQATRRIKERSSWAIGCLANRGFRQYKIYMLDAFINSPEFKVKDIYFDLSEACSCFNKFHGCQWKDDFGHTMKDNDLVWLREFLVRIRRILQKKHPDAAIWGHVHRRLPSEVFFDRLVMGENFARDVGVHGNYYDVLSPEGMQYVFASRANEVWIGMAAQIYRMITLTHPELISKYDPYAPENDRAIRHANAYFMIHEVSVKTVNKEEGRQWVLPLHGLYRMGEKRSFSAYYHDRRNVHAEPEYPRFIYALYSGEGKGMLVVLNDTDEPVRRRVSVDFAAAGITRRIGKDVFENGEFDFGADGTVELELPPRESRFIYFGDEGETVE